MEPNPYESPKTQCDKPHKISATQIQTTFILMGFCCVLVLIGSLFSVSTLTKYFNGNAVLIIPFVMKYLVVSAVMGFFLAIIMFIAAASITPAVNDELRDEEEQCKK